MLPLVGWVNCRTCSGVISDNDVIEDKDEDITDKIRTEN